MVMALSAGERNTQKCCRCCIDTVKEVYVALLFGDGSAFTVKQVVTVKACCDPLSIRSTWQ